MGLVLAFMLMITPSGGLKAQVSEIGFGLGGLTYTGELQRGYNILGNRPAATVMLKFKIRDHINFRAGVTGGMLRDSDSNPADAFDSARGAAFSIWLIEASTGIEYYFFDFKDRKSLLRWSPYFVGGFGIFTFLGEGDRSATYSNVQAVIPLGVGIKYVYNPRWLIGVEFGIRKTFFDYLDNISDGERVNKNFQYGNSFDNDFYYFLGVTLNYSFYRVPCPFPAPKPFRK